MINLNHVTFRDIEKRHGKEAALELVRTMEKLAEIQDEAVALLDYDVRFRNALEALSKINFAERSYDVEH